MPEFRFRLNGIIIPEINVREGGRELAVLTEYGWIVVDERPDMVLEWRDETAWALLPLEMCQQSVDKGWNRATPQELVGILWNTGVLQ
jgi:hypothetical protein